MKKLLFLFLLLPTCSIVSMERPAAAAHEHSDEENTFVCRISYKCNDTFASKSSLDRHMITVHRFKLPHKCPISDCRMSYRQPTRLKKHIQKKHIGVPKEAAAAPTPPVICDVCNKQLTNLAKLRKHQYLHTDKPFACTLEGCNKRFIKQFKLDQHLRIVHMFVLPHKCQISHCRMSFSKLHSFEMHRRKQHKNYKLIEMPEEAAAAAIDFTEKGFVSEECSLVDKEQECNLRELPELTPEEIAFLLSLKRKTILDLPDDMEL